jgi:leucyl/phenylalanyl-tRNA--protein transferase
MVFPIQLDDSSSFPAADYWRTEPIVAVGRTLTPELVLNAYRSGAYLLPYGRIISCWWSPEERGVLYPQTAKTPRSVRKAREQGGLEVRVDTAFQAVVHQCAQTPRQSGQPTWIVAEIARVFSMLHALGHAHSFETWRDGRLVGGLYGLAIGRVFFGESMFHHEPAASKVALSALLAFARQHGFAMVDCQDFSPTVAMFGAEVVPRERFLDELEVAVAGDPLPGSWTKLAAAL